MTRAATTHRTRSARAARIWLPAALAWLAIAAAAEASDELCDNADWAKTYGNDWTQAADDWLWNRFGWAEESLGDPGNRGPGTTGVIEDEVYVAEDEGEPCWALQSMIRPVPSFEFGCVREYQFSKTVAEVCNYAFAEEVGVETATEGWGREYISSWAVQNHADDALASTYLYFVVGDHAKVSASLSSDAVAYAEIEGKGCAIVDNAAYNPRVYFNGAYSPHAKARVEVEAARESEANMAALSYVKAFGISGSPNYVTGQGFDDYEDSDNDIAVCNACEQVKIRAKAKGASAGAMHHWVTQGTCARMRGGAMAGLLSKDTDIALYCPDGDEGQD